RRGGGQVPGGPRLRQRGSRGGAAVERGRPRCRGGPPSGTHGRRPDVSATSLTRPRLAAVPDPVDARRRVLRAVAEHVPDLRLPAARTVVERAGVRLRLSGDHCVVALAGATGSGKSSLFNALAKLELSQVGVRRPTTGVAHACMWGTDRAGPL